MIDESVWLASIRASLLRGDLPAAIGQSAGALEQHPGSHALQRARAGVLKRAGRDAEAESLLRALLRQNASDVATAFELTRLLIEQGRTAAAAATMRACFTDEANARDPDLAINAIELLDNCDRKADAAAIALSAIAQRPNDARLHAYASMLQMQTGDFGDARQHYLFALDHDERAWEWHLPIGMSSAQRYADSGHPDFALFRSGLQREDLSEKARAELHFALAKAHDDIGRYKEAAGHLREGNAIINRLMKWSRKDWRRSVESRLAANPVQQNLEPPTTFTPIFIVGMPRSGTTLLAELLSRYPRVRNRGELPWIATLYEQINRKDNIDQPALQRAAAVYAAQSRQDDADDASWFVDKQPLNFRYVDLMLAMFPGAKIIHSQRGARDTALSLWMRCFQKDAQLYSYNFGNIALVMRDCARLVSHWQQRYPGSIRRVRYEDLTAKPQATLESIAAWIGLPELSHGDVVAGTRRHSTISTASLWQARQPVNTRSVGRWLNYAPYVAEIAQIPDTLV